MFFLGNAQRRGGWQYFSRVYFIKKTLEVSICFGRRLIPLCGEKKRFNNVIGDDVCVSYAKNRRPITKKKTPIKYDCCDRYDPRFSAINTRTTRALGRELYYFNDATRRLKNDRRPNRCSREVAIEQTSTGACLPVRLCWKQNVFGPARVQPTWARSRRFSKYVLNQRYN